MSNQENAFYNNSTVSPVYINEVKLIQPKKGDGYIACKATILDGPCDKPNYQNIDLIVKGTQAIEALNSFSAQWPAGYQKDQNSNDRVKVFAFVRIGSISTAAFLKKDKTPGSILKGKLMEITYLKLNDDVLVHTNAKANDENANSSPAAAEAEHSESRMHA